jgi:hypothetical protein
MNYADNLRATAVRPTGPVAAAVFPAYGALAGVWVPGGATEVRIEAVPVALPLAPLWRVLGLALLAAAVAASRPRYN